MDYADLLTKVYEYMSTTQANMSTVTIETGEINSTDSEKRVESVINKLYDLLQLVEAENDNSEFAQFYIGALKNTILSIDK